MVKLQLLTNSCRGSISDTAPYKYQLMMMMMMMIMMMIMMIVMTVVVVVLI